MSAPSAADQSGDASRRYAKTVVGPSAVAEMTARASARRSVARCSSRSGQRAVGLTVALLNACLRDCKRPRGVLPLREVGGGSTRCRRCDQRDGRTTGECRWPFVLSLRRARSVRQRGEMDGSGWQKIRESASREILSVDTDRRRLSLSARLAARAQRRRERQHMSARTYNRNKMSSVPLLRVRDR